MPCFVRQALDVARIVSLSQEQQVAFVRDMLKRLAEMDWDVSPVLLAQQMHRVIREQSGKADPYKQLKEQSNHLALELLPSLQQKVRNASDPLDMAVRLSIAGNIIDYGAFATVDRQVLETAVQQAVEQPCTGDLEALRTAIDQADSILYLCDNAGEIVFDRLLLEQLPLNKVTVVVKASPVLNDALLEDAQMAGITELVPVIDNGGDAPGTLLDCCSAEFRARFQHADLILAKGQGNYESLSEIDRPIWFLLKAKCPVIANDIGCAVGDMVLQPLAG